MNQRSFHVSKNALASDPPDAGIELHCDSFLRDRVGDYQLVDEYGRVLSSVRSDGCFRLSC
jgi:hypothetical protein